MHWFIASPGSWAAVRQSNRLGIEPPPGRFSGASAVQVSVRIVSPECLDERAHRRAADAEQSAGDHLVLLGDQGSLHDGRRDGLRLPRHEPEPRAQETTFITAGILITTGLAAQLWPGRAPAAGAAVAVLVVGLLARMVGDGVDALAWLRCGGNCLCNYFALRLHGPKTPLHRYDHR